MSAAGITSLGQSYSPTFTPNIVSDPYSSFTDEDMYRDVSFPTQAMADAYDYGYGQKIGNLYDANTGTIPSYALGYGVNPSVFANIYGGGPNSPYNRGAMLTAMEHNMPSTMVVNPNTGSTLDYVGPQNDLLDIINYVNAFERGDIPVDEMYADELAPGDLNNARQFDPDMYTSTAQAIMNEPNTFIADQMSRYARSNPFVQDLSGTNITEAPDGTLTMTPFNEGLIGVRDVVGDRQLFAAENADMIRDRQIDRENPFYNDPILNMVEPPTGIGDMIPQLPISNYQLMASNDSYSLPNLLQMIQDARDAGNEDELQLLINDLEMMYPGATTTI